MKLFALLTVGTKKRPQTSYFKEMFNGFSIPPPARIVVARGNVEFGQ